MSTVALLRVEHLVKRFGGLAATDDASLSVEDGEIHALIGPNGAGKTTLIHQLSGALEPTSGTIWFGGQNITGLPMHARVHLGLVRSYQITSVFKRLSVLDNLALAVQAKSGSSLRFLAARAQRARALRRRNGRGRARRAGPATGPPGGRALARRAAPA
jgi:branched-chain amino acid transport system ATP-binding protein